MVILRHELLDDLSNYWKKKMICRNQYKQRAFLQYVIEYVKLNELKTINGIRIQSKHTASLQYDFVDE